MDAISKIKHTLDGLFGKGTSQRLPKNIEVTFSKKTGRIRHVYEKNKNHTDEKPKLLCTFRTDGGVALTPYFANLLVKRKSFRQNCIEVDKEAAPFINEGKSVFCKHVKWCGKEILIGADVPVIFNSQVIAIGKAVLSSEMISDLNKGVAVKIRDTLKTANRGNNVS